MRIGIDLRPLQAETKHRGIGKALEFFLREVASSGTKDELVFYIDDTLQKPPIIDSFPHAKIIAFNSHSVTRRKYIRSVTNPWRQLRVSPVDIDILLQYDAALGIPKNVPTAVIFHDLIPYLFHEEEKKAAKTGSFKRTLKNRLAGAAYWKQYNRFLKRYKNAATIIAISDSSKSDYIDHFEIPKGQRIVTIPHGVEESFFVTEPAKLSSELSKIVTKPYFFYVGGIDYRKNIPGLLEDFLKVRQDYDIQLVLAGKEFALQDQLNDLGWKNTMRGYPEFESDIIRPGFVSHEDLIALLSNAAAFVFPSRYEGFGMPLLEAMAANCPVITYGNSSLKEVVGDTGTVIPDGQSLAPAMKQAIVKPKSFRKNIPRARLRAQEFTWSETKKAILNELHRYRDGAS